MNVIGTRLGIESSFSSISQVGSTEHSIFLKNASHGSPASFECLFLSFTFLCLTEVLGVQSGDSLLFFIVRNKVAAGKLRQLGSFPPPSSCRIYRTEKDLHLDPSCFAPHYSSLCKGRLKILSLAGTCFFYLGSCYDA